MFGFSQERCLIACCLEMQNSYDFFFSNYPGKVDPTWNLIYLFSPLIWGLVIGSILMTYFVFKISSNIYAYMGMSKSLFYEEMVLVPVR